MPLFTPLKYVDGCPICEAAKAKGERPFIGHDNCLSPWAVGHSGKDGHCTASGCY